MKKFDRFIKLLILLLPCTLYFSYHPLIYLGSSQLMNFELSLPLIFLVIYAISAFIYFFENRRTLCKTCPRKMVTILALFPLYATISIFWSRSSVHGFLASGILWLIYIAVISFVWLYRDFFADRNFVQKCLKFFIYFSLVICGVCWLQSILDVAGLDRTYTLLCSGCTYKIFGFPHPNGFMAEPQYLGGILLAPTLISLYQLIQKPSIKSVLISAFFAATLFFTLSRGAIYAFIIALVFLIVANIAKQKTAKSLLLLPLILCSFLFSLNAEGLFAQYSKTDDTYFTGISKAINQLSLGLIDLSSITSTTTEITPETTPETVVETSAPIETTKTTETSTQDGYVEASTNGRLTLSIASFELWRSEANYTIFGTGIGGAGATIYHDFVDPGTQNREDMKNLLVSAGVDIPSLNVQSEYAELLVEFGLIGVILIIIIIIVFIKLAKSHPHLPLLISLVVAYLIAMLFCSGLTNSLYLYLYLPFFALILERQNAH